MQQTLSDRRRDKRSHYCLYKLNLSYVLEPVASKKQQYCLLGFSKKNHKNETKINLKKKLIITEDY